MNIFIWRLHLFSIPTRERLSYRGIEVEMITYPVCSHSVETIDHLFTGFRELIQLWTHIAIRWGFDILETYSIESLISFPDAVRLSSGQRSAFEAVFWTSCWCLWNFHRSIIFGTILPRESGIFYEVVDRVFFLDFQ